MTVKNRDALNFYDGFTWHVATPSPTCGTKYPCYEIHWSESGAPTLTGRYALLSESEASETQKKGSGEPHYADDEPVIMSHDAYIAEVKGWKK